MNFGTQDLVVKYGRDGRKALDGVTMEVPDGALYAVLGPIGLEQVLHPVSAVPVREQR